MKKTFRLALLSALLVTAGFASAQAQNSGRLSVQSASYSGVTGIGASLSHAEVQSNAFAASNAVANIPTLTGSVSGAATGGVSAVAYNTSIGAGFGSASAGGWADSTVNLVAKNPNSEGTLTLDGGMINAVLNGTDAHVVAGTSQDGFANGTYSAQGTLVGSQTTIVGTSVLDTTANAGAVTFTGGVPVGQSAAYREANSGVTANTTADFSNITTEVVIPALSN